MRWPPIFQLVTIPVGSSMYKRVVGDIIDQETETAFALEQNPLILLVFSEHSNPEPR